MYRSFYNLQCKPFENTPDPDFLFLSNQHQEALASLLYGIKEAKGFILITGSVGTGKTTLVRAFLQKSDSTHIIISIINPKTSFDDVYKQLRKKLSLDSDETNQIEGIEKLKERLLELNEQGRRVVILVDEAHLLQEDSLEEIRLLSNIEHDKEKLIQIVLIGQNEIYDILAKESQKSLKQRIVINRQLIPLDEAESSSYIKHRLQVAGSDRSIFNNETIKLIWKKSKGAPRLINQICDNALLIGYATEVKTITKLIIKEVIQDMEKRTVFTQCFKGTRPANKTVLAIAASLILGLGIFLGQNQTALPPEPIKATAVLDIVTPKQANIKPNKIDVLPQTNIISKSLQPATFFPQTNKQTVKTKDLLTDIAYREYGTMSETVIDFIQRANNITDINKIYSGQKIRLPKITFNDLITRKYDNHFHIHYASFYSDIPAKLVVKRLKNEGKHVNIEKEIQGVNKIYRVYIGDFPDIATAKLAINDLDFKYLSFFKKTTSIAFN